MQDICAIRCWQLIAGKVVAQWDHWFYFILFYLIQDFKDAIAIYPDLSNGRYGSHFLYIWLKLSVVVSSDSSHRFPTIYVDWKTWSYYFKRLSLPVRKHINFFYTARRACGFYFFSRIWAVIEITQLSAEFVFMLKNHPFDLPSPRKKKMVLALNYHKCKGCDMMWF
jgi:hypothetical protein